jgi:ribosomal protein L32
MKKTTSKPSKKVKKPTRSTTKSKSTKKSGVCPKCGSMDMGSKGCPTCGYQK